MNLTSAYAPTSLNEVIGQPAIVQRLKAFLTEPYPQWMAFVGPTGVGKTTCGRIVGDALADPWFGIHRVSGAALDLNMVKDLFGNDSPFRFKTAPNHLHCVHIEELEQVPNKATIALKDAWDVCRDRNWRVVVIATSNGMSGMEEALVDRFGSPFEFDNGPEFATAFCKWMKTVWSLESREPIPSDYTLWGFGRDASFSARRALDVMESRLLGGKVPV